MQCRLVRLAKPQPPRARTAPHRSHRLARGCAASSRHPLRPATRCAPGRAAAALITRRLSACPLSTAIPCAAAPRSQLHLGGGFEEPLGGSGAPPGGGGLDSFTPPPTVGLGGGGGYPQPSTPKFDGNAAQMATAGGDFGLDQPSSTWGDDGGFGGSGGLEIQGAEGWGVDELENALPKDLQAALKK